jgi:hypothetical protein
VQVQLPGVLHPNIHKDAHVGLTRTDIKGIANNHACTLVDFFNLLHVSLVLHIRTFLKDVRVVLSHADFKDI